MSRSFESATAATVPHESTSPTGWAFSKLRAHHLEGAAMVYVRQSTAQQVLDHRESTARQYALVDMAVRLGWPPDRVEVIDEDQGHSGPTPPQCGDGTNVAHEGKVSTVQRSF